MSQENKRIEVSFEHAHDQFWWTVQDKESLNNRQYFRLYNNRVRVLKQKILETAREVIDKDVSFTSLSDVKPNTPVLICGVTIKKCKNMVSVMEEFKKPQCEDEDELWEQEDAEEEAELNAENPFAKVTSLCCPQDSVELEDDKQRIPLTGPEINKDHYVTGNVMGFFGFKNNTEDFVVEKVIRPKLPEQKPWPKKVKDSYIMFISGFNLNAQISKNEWKMAAFAQLSEFLQGNSLDMKQCDLAQKVARVLFVGDTLRLSSQDYTRYTVTRIGQKQSFEPHGLEQLDRLMEEMTVTCPVTLMPGLNDICSGLLPQQPMLRKAFLRNNKHSEANFNLVTNPYGFVYDGVKFLGMSGQNMDDMLRYTQGRSVIELMTDLLEHSHICPTCPSTADGYPYLNRDPLLITEIPHVFFVGNQDKFASEMVTLSNGAKVQILVLPRFSQTHEVHLFNPKTLETVPFEVFVDEDLIEKTHFYANSQSEEMEVD
ncbi:unnamed protein product [Bursaphelenchus okinawaensis]|uniref:DNA polymerase delta small subunit n=1 Tax=Bursaphelenchus okinawaensis TaxID=465554 RepID=A0A811KRZ1_9BILA|nr:unnamed protein product [Bursaphelenchus okinawaensis]CAG9112142.1 unnamed protein product [Bursaphelenchus okinawaensis]